MRISNSAKLLAAALAICGNLDTAEATHRRAAHPVVNDNARHAPYDKSAAPNKPALQTAADDDSKTVANILLASQRRFSLDFARGMAENIGDSYDVDSYVASIKYYLGKAQSDVRGLFPGSKLTLPEAENRLTISELHAFVHAADTALKRVAAGQAGNAAWFYQHDLSQMMELLPKVDARLCRPKDYAGLVAEVNGALARDRQMDWKVRVKMILGPPGATL